MAFYVRANSAAAADNGCVGQLPKTTLHVTVNIKSQNKPYVATLRLRDTVIGCGVVDSLGETVSLRPASYRGAKVAGALTKRRYRPLAARVHKT